MLSYSEIDALEKPPPKIVLKPLDLVYHSTMDTFYLLVASSSNECLGCIHAPMTDAKRVNDSATLAAIDYVMKFDKRNNDSKERLVVEVLG